MDRGSYDSTSIPLNQARFQPDYSGPNTPGNKSPYDGPSNFAESGYYGSAPIPQKKKGVSPWIKFGLPILVVVIVAAVVAGVVASRKSNKSSAISNTPGSPSPNGSPAGPGVTGLDGLAVFPVATDSYELPVYPQTTNTALFTVPTFTTNPKLTYPADPFQPANPSPTQLRQDHPRLIAPAYKWAVLPELVQQDPYLSEWNATIFGNATDYFNSPPVPYVVDGALTKSGILDPCRQVKERIKAWAYAYRMTNDSRWAERAWTELETVAGNTSTSWGPDVDRWNSLHFLDTAEMTAAFAIGYDWLFDYWSVERRTAIMWSIITYGLNFGNQAYTDLSFGWWSNNITGNWNCVCNSGLTMGALAIFDEDPTGVSQAILAKSIPNAVQNCIFGVSEDGSWSETANYWYFGTDAMAEMASSLQTATGSQDAFGMLSTNPSLNETGAFHIYIQGMTSLFNYGDHGPNKYSTTSNANLFFGGYFNIPAYQLHQRDQQDSAEPTAMFWYEPTVSGAWWDNLALDHYFPDPFDSWFSARTTWTNNNGLYIAMKASQALNHQTHGDLDCGDFVIDALGQRWAGELGSADYDSPDYFSSEAQNSPRWTYYRKMTEGQNTLLINAENQLVTANPTTTFGTTGDQQGSSTVNQLAKGSTAFFVADMTTAYNNSNSVKRGIRFVNDRQQILLQDEINVGTLGQWRMHTNATVSIDSSGTTATLSLGGQKMTVQILNASQGTVFGTSAAVRLPTDPPPPVPDQPNPGVTVLTIDFPAGVTTLEVLFTPQYPNVDTSSFPDQSTVVPLAQWSTTSHS
ncbi:hypothetical protein Clacol_004123 [Clathrus columnatus]|uniref:Heparinase II/III-like C-terminal domain-containing protein n=1 Tax=Clathrus columnatus TaxID=1419009 RepID=A0AAV5A5J8_9AGAM|nr:hypothetical protein Clacol_004123 [Clathrus columnatus]